MRFRKLTKQLCVWFTKIYGIFKPRGVALYIHLTNLGFAKTEEFWLLLPISFTVASPSLSGANEVHHGTA